MKATAENLEKLGWSKTLSSHCSESTYWDFQGVFRNCRVRFSKHWGSNGHGRAFNVLMGGEYGDLLVALAEALRLPRETKGQRRTRVEAVRVAKKSVASESNAIWRRRLKALRNGKTVGDF